MRYQGLARNLRAQFNGRYSKFTQETEVLIWGLSREVWNCDPTNNASYTKLTNFIQGYVDNKINLTPEGSCSPMCRDLKQTRNYHCNQNTLCGRNYLDSNKTRCNGVVRDCDFFDSGMTYCPNVSVEAFPFLSDELMKQLCCRRLMKCQIVALILLNWIQVKCWAMTNTALRRFIWNPGIIGYQRAATASAIATHPDQRLIVISVCAKLSPT